MHLTDLDLLFWAAGFLENLGLLFVLWYRRRARSFPFFTALITLIVIKTVVLYFVLHYGSKDSYFYTYWSLTVLDTTLQLCVVYEIASRVFKPLDVWADDVRSSYAWLLGLSLCIAFGLTWLASPPARTWMQAFATKGNLFAAVLQSELFVAMMALSMDARLPWRTHVAKIAQGLGAYSLLGVLIETGHSYFGVGRQLPGFLILSHIRMAAYLVCVNYWIINLWRAERPARIMTSEMREKMFALQTLVEYDLQDLRSRKKL
ncbi:MAG TPA: hypothetical protein VFE27_05710 [Acidobacteriaceae bacterium]|nr:hypothetical protein [Acidobacteriaceae bacterium]